MYTYSYYAAQKKNRTTAGIRQAAREEEDSFPLYYTRYVVICQWFVGIYCKNVFYTSRVVSTENGKSMKLFFVLIRMISRKPRKFVYKNSFHLLTYLFLGYIIYAYKISVKGQAV